MSGERYLQYIYLRKASFVKYVEDSYKSIRKIQMISANVAKRTENNVYTRK